MSTDGDDAIHFSVQEADLHLHVNHSNFFPPDHNFKNAGFTSWWPRQDCPPPHSSSPQARLERDQRRAKPRPREGDSRAWQGSKGKIERLDLKP